MEIEMFFARYDLDGDRVIAGDEIKKMLEHLTGKGDDEDCKNAIFISKI